MPPEYVDWIDTDYKRLEPVEMIVSADAPQRACARILSTVSERDRTSHVHAARSS